jgi:hypothetical protein
MNLRRAVSRALALRADAGITGVATPEDVDRAIAVAGAERWSDDAMPADLYGLYYRGVIRVRSGLAPETAAFVAAHELAHGVLGHRRGSYRLPLVGGTPPRTVDEEEAEVFAFALHLGRPSATHEGLTAQLHRGNRARLPLGFLFGAVNVLAPRTRPRRRRLAPRVPEAAAQRQVGAELFD